MLTDDIKSRTPFKMKKKTQITQTTQIQMSLSQNVTCTTSDLTPFSPKLRGLAFFVNDAKPITGFITDNLGQYLRQDL